VPFSQGWTRLTAQQEAIYFGTFIATSLATALLLTPTAFHRLRFRQADKERLLRIANVAAIAGLLFLLVAVTGCVFLIADLLFNALAASIVAAIIAGGLCDVVVRHPALAPSARGRRRGDRRTRPHRGLTTPP
jgi:apolipoprotein N-acyltransferase